MKHVNSPSEPSKKQFLGILLTVVVIILLFTSIKVIDDGQVGVKKTLGHISDTEVGTGLTVIVPFIQSMEIYDVKTQEIKEASQVPSSEGLIITLDVSVIYHLENTDVAELRKSVNKNFKETLIIPYIRSEIRDTVSAYEAKTIYSQEGREKVALTVKNNLIKRLGSRGIVIEDVLLRDIKLPTTVTQAIELKLQKEQESQRKEFELISATKDAEIEVARARGVAQANEIISGSISQQYIQYLWVQGLNDGNSEVIYVPTEANLPILEATRNSNPSATLPIGVE